MLYLTQSKTEGDGRKQEVITHSNRREGGSFNTFFG